MATATQLQSLKLALSIDRPPLCGGAISPSPKGLHLYYGKKDPRYLWFLLYIAPWMNAFFLRFIDFTCVTSKELNLLFATRRPVPFHHESEDVYNESYRKALKLEAPDFAVRLDLVGSGLMRNVEDKLLQHEMENKCLRGEVCELNAYGKHCPEPPSTVALSNVAVPVQIMVRSPSYIRVVRGAWMHLDHS